MSNVNQDELTEDIEVVGPGQMLADARKSLNLSIEDVAQNLNFRVSQVTDLEADIFDKSLPETFNRGYLINYARLVNVPTDQVVSAYEMLGIAEQQGAEMQSFSKITEKEAQNNRLNWLTYLIVLILIALPVAYYIQDAKNLSLPNLSEPEAAPAQIETQSTAEPSVEQSDTVKEPALDETQQILAPASEEPLVEQNNESSDINSEIEAVLEENTTAGQIIDINTLTEPQQSSENTTMDHTVEAVFTFAGDCWVNIQDATQERIAYGIKKAGYVMTISGVPPFKVTVGKPELVTILYNGEAVDMSQYNSGNIAKFTLPINSES